MKLTLVFSRKYRWPEHYFSVYMIFRKFSEINCYWPNFNQYNIFYHYKYFFFQSVFWSLFNHRQRSQSNKEQCSLCCSSPCFLVLFCTHCGWLQCLSTYFWKWKESRVLPPIIFRLGYFLRLCVKPVDQLWK